MLDRLGPGDMVTVTRTDHLAGSTFGLFSIVERIVDAKAQFRSLAEPWASDAGGPWRTRGCGTRFIRTRAAERRSRAKAQGKHMGRPPSLTPSQRKEAARRRAQGATLQELADNDNVGINTVRRHTRTAA